MTWLLIKDSFYVRGRPGMMHKKNWDNTVVKKTKKQQQIHIVMRKWCRAEWLIQLYTIS